MRVSVVVCRDALWLVCEAILVLQVLSSSILSFIAVLFPKSMERTQATASELIFHTETGLKYYGITVKQFLFPF